MVTGDRTQNFFIFYSIKLKQSTFIELKRSAFTTIKLI